MLSYSGQNINKHVIAGMIGGWTNVALVKIVAFP